MPRRAGNPVSVKEWFVSQQLQKHPRRFTKSSTAKIIYSLHTLNVKV